MRKIFFSVLIFLSILFLGSSSMAFGEMTTSSVGVASGDVFRYSYTCYFNSNDPTAVPPASFSWINQTDYFMVNVTRVSGSSISFNTMMLGLNGSSSLGVCSMNVGTGMASISGYGGPTGVSNFYFMARNVGMMGRMFPSANGSPTINDTLMMSYLSGQRLTNHFVTTTSQSGMMVNSDFYFDQATGMMVEWRQQSVQMNGSLQANNTQMMKITSSSVWAVPEFSPSSIIPLLLVGTISVASAVVLICKGRSRAHISCLNQENCSLTLSVPFIEILLAR
jgi:hypothetical protein